MDSSFSTSHYRSEIEALKRRLRDQEDLFNSQDEEWQQEVAALKKEKKSLTEEVKALRSELMETKDELTLLMQKANGTPKKEIIKVIQPAPLSPSPADESFLNEFEAVQDRCEALKTDKVKLEMEIAELTKEIERIVDINAELDSSCTEKDDVIRELKRSNTHLTKDLREMTDLVSALENQLNLKPTNEPVLTLREEMGMSSDSLIESKEEKIKELSALIEVKDEKIKELSALIELKDKKNKELEFELAALRRSIYINSEKAKDVDHLRETLKNFSEQNKGLKKKIEELKDVEAEKIAISQINTKLASENDKLIHEREHLKKLLIAAESRADELAHMNSKIQAKNEDSGVERNSSRRASSNSVNSSISTQSVPSAVPKRRGILRDVGSSYSERRLDFNVVKLGNGDKKHQTEHLKSHYNPKIGAYDPAFGECPAQAAKLQTPKKENKMLTDILRTPTKFFNR